MRLSGSIVIRSFEVDLLCADGVVSGSDGIADAVEEFFLVGLVCVYLCLSKFAHMPFECIILSSYTLIFT